MKRYLANLWILILAVVAIVISVTFLVIGPHDNDVDADPLFNRLNVAVTLSGVMIPLAVWMRRKWLLQNGIAAEGSIISVDETKLMEDDEPVFAILIEVEHPNGSRYQATAHKTLGMLDIVRTYTPGKRVTLRVDRARPDRIIIDDRDSWTR